MTRVWILFCEVSFYHSGKSTGRSCKTEKFYGMKYFFKRIFLDTFYLWQDNQPTNKQVPPAAPPQLAQQVQQAQQVNKVRLPPRLQLQHRVHFQWFLLHIWLEFFRGNRCRLRQKVHLELSHKLSKKIMEAYQLMLEVKNTYQSAPNWC